jgi:hypothetical protein
LDSFAQLRRAGSLAARRPPLPDAEKFCGEVSLDHLVGP